MVDNACYNNDDKHSRLDDITTSLLTAEET